jgi:hypothetical protein
MPDKKAGLRIVDEQGNYPETGAPTVSEPSANVLQVAFATSAGQVFDLVFHEDHFEVACANKGNTAWFLELKTAPGVDLPFQTIASNRIYASQNGFTYQIECSQGTIEKADGCVFRIQPKGNKIVINCSKK